MKWLRLYHDTPNDPKWRLVAAESGQSEAVVLAVWVHMLVNASAAKARGTLEGWDDRIVGAGLGLKGDAVAAVRDAMQGITLDGLRLTGWDKRQRATDNVAERVRRHRDKGAPTGGGGGHGGNGLNGTGNGAVTLQEPDVTLHSPDVTEKHLRAQTTDTESKKGSEATASGAAAPSAVVPFPMDDKARLFGPVLAALVASLPRRNPDDIRAKVAKAYHALGVETALDLTARAAVKDEPWSWFCKAIDSRIKPKPPAGGRADPNASPANAYFLERYAEAEKQAAQWSAS